MDGLNKDFCETRLKVSLFEKKSCECLGIQRHTRGRYNISPVQGISRECTRKTSGYSGDKFLGRQYVKLMRLSFIIA